MTRSRSDGRLRLFFASSNATWGGSEELWSAAAAVLRRQGHDVVAFRIPLRGGDARMEVLRKLGCRIHEAARLPLLPRRTYSAMRLLAPRLADAFETVRLRTALTLHPRPDLVVISQGTNVNGIHLIACVRRMGLPYVLIVQKAVDARWPADEQREQMRDAYVGAQACFFVSEHNRRLTEEQIATTLPNASVVRNPFAVSWTPRNEWPDGAGVARIACVGRLDTAEKGQDLLLRLLARPRWRERPLAVTFYGSGPQQQALEEMAAFHGLHNVSFAGFVRDPSAVWDDNQALVLPSRCEGLPLVVVEAMLSGRVPIVTNAGGNAEMIDDGVTGFVAKAPTVDALDDAMERAWSARADWRSIGQRAAETARKLVPADPAEELAATLTSLAASAGSRWRSSTAASESDRQGS